MFEVLHSCSSSVNTNLSNANFATLPLVLQNLHPTPTSTLLLQFYKLKFMARRPEDGPDQLLLDAGQDVGEEELAPRRRLAHVGVLPEHKYILISFYALLINSQIVWYICRPDLSVGYLGVVGLWGIGGNKVPNQSEKI